MVATACSSTKTPEPTTSGGTARAPIPQSAFSDTTGLTASTVSIGNVSTHFSNLFTGAAVGTQAYANYVNSMGGVHGRMLKVNTYDDNFSGQTNQQETQAAIADNFATVGGFSLQDNFGGHVLAQNPQVPNVTVSLDLATGSLPNSFSPQPAVNGWMLGPLTYFKTMYPDKISHVGVLVADETSAEVQWAAEKAAMGHLGYNVIYDQTFPITQTDFNANIIEMKSAGVQILFLEQMPAMYAGPVMKALAQQDFHPTVVFGASTYSNLLVTDSGGAANVQDAYLEQADTLYLGEDRGDVPAVDTFLTWVQKTDPGWSPDLYTLYGWISAELFTQALNAAGPNPTRGSVLEALRDIHSFTGNHIVATSDPANRIPPSCYIISRFDNGTLNRLDDPPINGPTNGFRCGAYFYVK